MDKTKKAILCSLIAASVASWFASQAFQGDMMSAMGATANPLSLSVFTSVWTVGMAAMMFPAIAPMVMLYGTIVNSAGQGQVAAASARRTRSGRVVLFVGCYLVVWSLTGIALLLGWSEMMRTLPLGQSMNYVFAAVLLVAGICQFTPLKTKCLGYCESPLSFFMRRWKGGTAGAVEMGLYQGLYCLGCCWPYFLLMVALGWMNLFWMALFAAIIFGEKIWSKGIWVARAAGIGFIIAGILVAAGTLQIVPAMEDVDMPAEPTGSAEPTESMSDDSMDAMLLGAAPVKRDVLA
jgi:predicted metal-binding membrane protein